MERVRYTILEKWATELGGYEKGTQISGKQLKTLYKLYDKYAFHNQLQTKEKEENVSIVFQEEYPPNVEIERLCGIRYYFINKRKVINVRLSPWVESRVNHMTKKQMSKVEPYYEENIGILLAFEHQITHLIFLLWGHEESDVHGKLFECVHDAFFNENGGEDIMSVISSKNSYVHPPKKHGVYTYGNNSCYLDSLSSVLFFCKSSIFRDAIFTTNVDLISYATKNEPYMFLNTCNVDMTEIEFVDLTQKLQATMFEDYSDMLQGENKKCMDVRIILHECYPDIRSSGGSWIMYSVAEIYELIAHMFPRLLNTHYPYKYYSGDKIFDRISSDSMDKSMFTFWEFMEPSSNEDPEESYTRIDWDNIKSKVLVFRNGGNPSIINFGSIKSETISVPSFKKGKMVMEKIKITKGRNFSEYIIDDKYEMVGAVVLHGTTPGESGGMHYTSYVKVSDKWVEYNDLGTVWKYTNNNGSFPENILSEKRGIKPELYFYQKI